MLKDQKAWGHFYVGAAIVLQITAAFIFEANDEWGWPAIFVGLLANAFFLTGCYSYVKAKGQHGAWTFFGLFNIFGVLAIIALLPDKHRTTPPSMSPS